jgi:5-methyltetrahydrofolate--homocysteine methyltransferase
MARAGRIERHQVKDYARREGWNLAEAERWLAPILNYDPRAVAGVGGVAV